MAGTLAGCVAASLALGAACGRIGYVDGVGLDGSTDGGARDGGGRDGAPMDGGAFPARGLLDEGFAGGGVTVTGYDATLDERAYAVVATAEGGYLTSGTLRRGGGLASFALTRYGPSGALDEAWAERGHALLTFPPGYAYGYSLVAQPDGSHAVVGDGAYGGEDDVLVARVLQSGSVDTRFGVDGLFHARVPGEDTAADLLALPDGRLIACGVADYPLPDSGMLLLAVLPDGAPDPSFGTGGALRLDPGGAVVEGCHGVAVLPGGDLIVAGRSGDALVVLRLGPTGVVDSSFGAGGAFTLAQGRGADVLVDAEGRILVGGSISGDALVLRLLPDGALDGGFGNAGVARVELGADETFTSLAPSGDGRIVAAGAAGPAGAGDVLVARLTADGALDRSFGPAGDGTVTVDIGGDDVAHDVIVQVDGRVVTTGTTLGDATMLHRGFLMRLR